MSQLKSSERVYIWLAGAAALSVLLLIALGALVRVTNADTACGNTWHLCNGSILPPFSNGLAWIDWGHRLSTILAGVFTLGVFFAARRLTLARPEIVRASDLCLVLLFVQSLLGAGTLWIRGFPTFTLLHLSFAIIMLSCLVAAITALTYTPNRRLFSQDTFPQAVYGGTLMIFMVQLTGAMVISAKAENACQQFPLCGLPLNDAALIHLIHRGSVLVLGIILLLLVWRVQTERPAEKSVRVLVWALLLLYLIQGSIGGMITLWGGYFRALHVLFGGLTWAAAVALSMMMIKQQEVT